MSDFLQIAITIICTILIYLGARYINKRYPSPFTLPVMIGTIVIILILIVFQIPYATYNYGAKWINHLLGPAVVALSYPLYKQWDMLRRLVVPILGGVIVGAVVGVASGILLAKIFSIDDVIIYSLIPKSVTTPVAMDIGETIGGIPSLSAVFVMFAGIGGAVISSFVYRFAQMRHFLGKGIGIGSASHAIGIAMAMEHSEEEGAAGTVAMGLSSIIVSFITQPLVWLLM